MTPHERRRLAEMDAEIERHARRLRELRENRCGIVERLTRTDTLAAVVGVRVIAHG